MEYSISLLHGEDSFCKEHLIHVTIDKYTGVWDYNSITHYNLRSTISLKQPKCNTIAYGLNSFWYKGAKIWNDLPNKIKNSIIFEFKNQIEKWQGPKCLCNMCTILL